jgi:effector-binding domain-containing protein
MKFIKFLLFVILIVFIGGAIYFATQDGNYNIAQSKVINAPKSVVYDIVQDYKTWEQWGPWKAEEPEMTFNYPEKTTGEGGAYSWEGSMNGSMTTTTAVANTSLEQNLTIQTPGGERNPKVRWIFEDTDTGGTKVTWSMRGEHTLMDKAYFMFTGMDFDATQNDMYAKGLEGLSAMAFDSTQKHEVTANGITEYGGGFYLYKTSSANAQNISTTMGANYGVVMDYMNTRGVKQSGMPFTLYNEMLEGGSVIMSNAIPVKEKITVEGDATVLSGYIPMCKVVKVTLKGNYTYLSKAWEEAYAYVEKYRLEQIDKPFEVYTTDPGDYPNPADWITEIYIPVK